MRRLLTGCLSVLVYLWVLGMLAGIAGLVLAWGAYVLVGRDWLGVLIGGAALAWMAALDLAAASVLPLLLGKFWLEDTAQGR